MAAVTVAAAVTVFSSVAAVSAASYKLGDVNNDGEITIQDVTIVQRYLAEMTQLDDNAFKAADVNGDGNVDISDATTIQKYVAEIIHEFPAEKTEPTTQQITTKPQPATDADGYNNIIIKP